jgi:hypothetical protein
MMARVEQVDLETVCPVLSFCECRSRFYHPFSASFVASWIREGLLCFIFMDLYDLCWLMMAYDQFCITLYTCTFSFLTPGKCYTLAVKSTTFG